MSIIPTASALTIVLSAEQHWRDDGRNLEAHIELRERLARQFEIGELLAVYECRGAYKGVPERSFAITGFDRHVRTVARTEAERFNQESVLAIHSDGGGWLSYTERGNADYIGEYTPIESREGVDAWTTVLATGETFTFK